MNRALLIFMLVATTSVDRPQFEWRHAFYGLSTELAQCVGISLQNVSINSLREERDVFEKTCAVTSSQIQSSLVGENKKFPNYVSKVCKIKFPSLLVFSCSPNVIMFLNSFKSCSLK